MEAPNKNPTRRDPLRLLGFIFKAYIILASVAYSWWTFNILGSVGGRIESFVIRKMFNILLIGFCVSMLGLVVISVVQFERKQTKGVGWNLLFVAFALVWIALFAPALVK